MSARFDIQPLAAFAGGSAPVRRPKEIACFSYDDEHKFHLDDSSLRWFYPPLLGADLSKGFDTFQKLDDTRDDHLDSLLKTIISWEEKAGKKVDAGIITWRGMMTKIMAVPYSDRDGFEMNATLFQGTIFIEENHDYKLASWARQRQQRPPRGRPSQDMMSFWGYKFETLSLIPRPWQEVSRDYIEGREDEVVNNHAQYCSVVRTGMGNTTMVIGGEVDAVWDIKPRPPLPKENDPTPPAIGPINWVELKTSAEITSDRDMMYFERKLMKFWAQSFLLGVPKLIIGFRTQDGILKRLEEIDVGSIPATVRRTGQSWDGNVCVNFAARFMDWLKTVITDDQGVYRIRRTERSPFIEVFKVDEAGHGDILSDEFINWRIKLSMREAEKEKLVQQPV